VNRVIQFIGKSKSAFMTYKDKVYDSYRSAFKGTASSETLAFGAAKLRPVIDPWVTGLRRETGIRDLGCGAGELLLAFQQLGFENIGGCDLSEQQIAVAKTVTPQAVVANAFHYLENLPNESVGVITLFDIIEHLSKQECDDLFALIFEKLSPGGLLIGHAPNGLSPFVGHVYFGDPTHEWCPTPSATKTMLLVSSYVDFEAKEHLGASTTIVGRLRAVAWNLVRVLFSTINRIETGHPGCGVWTRNFAFKATKPTPDERTESESLFS
jgi:2-polyprenyl-3-methyl-5-hydroxy-6-metoxy-1,4-benzoquinol methylase